MANSYVNATNVNREAILTVMANASVVSGATKLAKDQFAVGGKKNTVVNMQKPVPAILRSGATFGSGDTAEDNVPVTVNQQHGFDITGITTLDLNMKVDQFNKQIIKPKAETLGAGIDNLLATGICKSVANFVGTPGVMPSDMLAFSQAYAIMRNLGAPADRDYTAHIPAMTNAQLLNNNAKLFNPTKEISNQWINGSLGEFNSMNFFTNVNLPAQTTGTRADAGVQVSAIGVEATNTITLKGLGANATVKAGEIFEIDNVYSVNPLTKQSTGKLMPFVVLADQTASAGGVLQITLGNGYYYASATDGHKNVTALPQVDANVTFQGAAGTTFTQSLVFHRSAVGFANISMPVPADAAWGASETIENVAMKIWGKSDIDADTMKLRGDVYWGYAVLRPEWCVRVWSL